MKTILYTNPTFTPGAANTGTLNFSSIVGFDLRGLLAVMNQTRGTILYAAGQASTNYFGWNSGTKVLTLKVDTTGHSSGDQLQVIYDGPSTAGQSGPALTTLISGGVTNSVITSSPAILLAINFGGIDAGGENPDSYFEIKSGSNTLLVGRGLQNQLPNLTTNGIDCPNGITITLSTGVNVNAQELSNCRTSVHYILK